MMKCKRILAGLASFMLVLSPISVYADEPTVVAQSEDGTQTYSDCASAWSAAKSGTPIVMVQDWITDSRFSLDEGQSATIYMSGHKIDTNLNGGSVYDGEVFYLDKNASLNLIGSTTNTTFKFNGYGYNGSSDSTTVSLTSGGLVTGGSSKNGAGAIHMKEGSTLNLENVAVGGNSSAAEIASNGGAINMNNDNCVVNMTNSIIAYNKANYGGGIYVAGENEVIEMKSSSIFGNYASENGGGICSNKDATYVHMSENSSINANYAKKSGGGIYFDNPYCQVTSTDTLAEISSNISAKANGGGGGGIYFPDSNRGNTAQVVGITFKLNQAESYGGAIYTDENDITIDNCQFYENQAYRGGAIYNLGKRNTISNCTMEENKAEYEGGAIYDGNEDTKLENCTIRKNEAGSEGGGVFVPRTKDITLFGTMIITNNKRSDGASDDLFLEKTWATTAYVKGEISSDSSVGIRTGASGTTQIGTDITSDCSKRFFLNDTGIYYIEYKDHKLYKSSSSPLSSSIFGNSNLGIAVVVMAGIIVVGVVCLGVHKKKNREEA
jgi:predicted outer membrane repeat protein